MQMRKGGRNNYFGDFFTDFAGTVYIDESVGSKWNAGPERKLKKIAKSAEVSCDNTF
jgi:hypothetical protein